MLDDVQWRKVTVREARELSQNGALVWWRPQMGWASKQPDDDPAWVAVL